MEKFEEPIIQIVVFAVEDVITTSGEFVPPVPDGNQTPYG